MLRRINRTAALGIALLLSSLFCFDAVDETDIGWHLALGRLISQSGIPFRNALSWTAPDEPWYPTSWLYDWIVARATISFGVPGLQVTTFVFVGLALLGLALAAEKVDRQSGPWAAPLAALLLIPRITERPHVATWTVMAWVLFLCVPTAEQRAQRGAERDESTWRRRLLCLPIIALGSNLHSGAAFAAIVFGLFCLETYWLGTRRFRELALAAAGGAALLVNPGGFFNVEYVLKHLHVQEVIELQEFLHPNFTRHRPFFFLVPLTLAIAWRLRRDWPALLGSLAVLAWLAFRASRVVYEFQLIAVVALPPAWWLIRQRWGSRAQIACIAAAACALMVFEVPDFRKVQLSATFHKGALPVRAAEFIRAEKIDGRVFNSFSDGGYLEWALPELPWFQDARVQAWPPEFFAREQEAEKSPEAFRAWLGELGVEWAVVSHWRIKLSGKQMLEVPEWALVYWDETNEIYLRRDVPRFAPLIDRLEYRRFRPYGSVAAGLPSASRNELEPWLRELERFQQSAPRFPDAWVLRCGLVRRLERPEQQDVCAKATEFARTDMLQRMLAWVNTLSAATN